MDYSTARTVSGPGLRPSHVLDKLCRTPKIVPLKPILYAHGAYTIGHSIDMTVQRGKLVSGGRIQLPAAMRRALSLGDGDTILLEMVDGEIHLRPLRDAVSRIQRRLRDYIPAEISLSEELIADRRAASVDE